LIEVDYDTKGNYSTKMRQSGIMTTNELRILNNLIPKSGEKYDEVYGNGNLSELGAFQNKDNNSNNENEEGIKNE
jgi:hypothetical protein